MECLQRKTMIESPIQSARVVAQQRLLATRACNSLFSLLVAKLKKTAAQRRIPDQSPVALASLYSSQLRAR
jgi:hypothetical protein